jgi:hypothetical protein
MESTLSSRLLYILLESSLVIMIALPADAALKGTISRSDNPTSQDALANDLPTEIDAAVPPASSQFNLHANDQNLVSAAAMQQFSQTKIRQEQAVMVRLPNKRKQLKSSVEHELSAIGIAWNWNSGVVIYVDKQSDLYTKVFQGDVYLSMNGIAPITVWQQRLNFGNEQTPVNVEFLQHGMVHDYTCVRHPLTWFSPWFSQLLRAHRMMYIN